MQIIDQRTELNKEKRCVSTVSKVSTKLASQERNPAAQPFLFAQILILLLFPSALDLGVDPMHRRYLFNALLVS